jgi:hypothetical protein
MGQPKDAIDCFRSALQRQRVFKGVQSNACFSFGRMAVEEHLTDCYDEILQALDEFGPHVFPWHAYMANGIRALIMAERGNPSEATELARRALRAADAKHSGFNRYPTVGLVNDTASRLHRELQRLASV